MDASLPPPQTQTVVLPFVSITVLENGQIQTKTNLKDKSLVLGLLETAKFQIMLGAPEKPLVQPGNGMSGLLKRMRP